MYRINRSSNAIEPLKKCSFAELGFRERSHLQEWIGKDPTILGEELLIIQKEFAGFSDTLERLDLLALDKEGSLVIIENKLDDTGRDTAWQALKYASYCAGLSRGDIRRIFQEYLDKSEAGASAEEQLCSFLEIDELQELVLNKSVTQRIILVAANFRKEVTSTVLWLANFKIRVQCFRVTPFSRGDELFLNVEQIIPTRDTEEFMIGLAEKARDEIENAEAEQRRHTIRRQFWQQAIQALSDKTELYHNVSPGTQSWISGGSGVGGLHLNLVATKDYARAELYIDRGEKEENERIFDSLLAQREAIHSDFGGELIWDRLEGRRACRIKAESDGCIYDPDSWEGMIRFLADSMPRLEKAVKSRLHQVTTR
jgi:uncharacterized protein DUF4268